MKPLRTQGYRSLHQKSCIAIRFVPIRDAVLASHLELAKDNFQSGGMSSRFAKENIGGKIDEYEGFVERLKRDLQGVMEARQGYREVRAAFPDPIDSCAHPRLPSRRRRDKFISDVKAYEDLRRNLANLKEQGMTELRTMVNLGTLRGGRGEGLTNQHTSQCDAMLAYPAGSDIYAHARVPDARRVFVNVGLGFQLECNWDEALALIPKRQAIVQLQARFINASHYGRNNDARLLSAHRSIAAPARLPRSDPTSAWQRRP